MIPESIREEDYSMEGEMETDRTYQLTDTQIRGITDGKDALRQAVYKVLNTELYEYPIYSFSYGIELENLVGKDITYVRNELRRRIRECLLEDERIEDVDQFEFQVSGDELSCTFEIQSIYGTELITKEVNI